MNCERTLVLSVLVLGLGIGLIFGYCHDSTVSFSAAHPAAAASLQIVIHTNGWPAMTGTALVVVGILLLFAAMVLAVLRELRHRDTSLPRKLVEI